jgi:hypothetical protein
LLLLLALYIDPDRLAHERGQTGVHGVEVFLEARVFDVAVGNPEQLLGAGGPEVVHVRPPASDQQIFRQILKYEYPQKQFGRQVGQALRQGLSADFSGLFPQKSLPSAKPCGEIHTGLSGLSGLSGLGGLVGFGGLVGGGMDVLVGGGTNGGTGVLVGGGTDVLVGGGTNGGTDVLVGGGTDVLVGGGTMLVGAGFESLTLKTGLPRAWSSIMASCSKAGSRGLRRATSRLSAL